MSEREELLAVSDLSKQFFLHMLDGKEISGCADVNFLLHNGEFMGIAGPSGAGKSTIIKCIYRTYLPTSGRMNYRMSDGALIDLAAASDREIIRLRDTEIGYVSQFLKVIPRVPAIDVLAEGLRQRGWNLTEARECAKDYLRLMNIDKSLWDAYPSTFSGGEQQRINLAKALITKPRLLLLDEPTASLDGETKKVVIQSLLTLKGEGTSIIGIFHDLDVVKRLVDRVFTMKAGRCKSIRRMQEVV